MDIKNEGFSRCFGSTTVGPRGQLVIPASARKELGLNPGTTLLVFNSFHGRGLVLLRADSLEEMVNMMSEKLTRFEKQMKDYLPNEKAEVKQK